MSIYRRIKDLATQKNISIRQIEIHFNFANGSMRKWTDNANPERLKKVADFLGTTPSYLRGEVDDDEPTASQKIDKPTAVDLAQANVFMYQGDKVDVDGIDEDDWAIIKAVLDRNRKNRKIGK